MRALSLFSGIGGFDIAAEWSGIEVAGMIENNTFCQKILKKHWPNVKLLGDIHDVKGDEFGTIDIVYGGPPCQPASCAGKREGKEDSRWLWGEAYRIIRATKPKWIILENVRGILSLEGGLVFENLLLELEAIGYETRAFCLPACAVNAPHRRDRVWIVANSKCRRSDRARGIQEPRENTREMGQGASKITLPTDCHAQDSEGLGCGSRRPESTGFIRSAGASGTDCHAADTESQQAHTAEPRGLHAEFSGTDSDATDTSNQRLQGSEWPGSYEQGQAAHGSIAECNHAWNEPWIEAATRLCGVDARVPNRVDRLKSLGNAIVPQVAYQIMKAILEVEHGK